jgi:transposase
MVEKERRALAMVAGGAQVAEAAGVVGVSERSVARWQAKARAG